MSKAALGKPALQNLAYASATHSARRTLLWDLDQQSGCRLLLGLPVPPRPRARSLIDRTVPFAKTVMRSGVEGLDLLPADATLHMLDHYLLTLGKKRRLAKLAEDMTKSYDRILLDCPPAFNEVTDQIIRAADLIVVPLQPSPLARAALADVQAYLLKHHRGHAPIMPIFSMFDGRRSIHKEAAQQHGTWPVVPMSSLVEKMGMHGKPVGLFAPQSKVVASITAIWTGIERKLSVASKKVH
jgi:chromosome partitioning protein